MNITDEEKEKNFIFTKEKKTIHIPKKKLYPSLIESVDGIKEKGGQLKSRQIDPSASIDKESNDRVSS